MGAVRGGCGTIVNVKGTRVDSKEEGSSDGRVAYGISELFCVQGKDRLTKCVTVNEEKHLQHLGGARIRTHRCQDLRHCKEPTNEFEKHNLSSL